VHTFQQAKSFVDTTWKVIAIAKIVRTDKIESARFARALNFVLTDMTSAIF